MSSLYKVIYVRHMLQGVLEKLIEGGGQGTTAEEAKY